MVNHTVFIIVLSLAKIIVQMKIDCDLDGDMVFLHIEIQGQVEHFEKCSPRPCVVIPRYRHPPKGTWGSLSVELFRTAGFDAVVVFEECLGSFLLNFLEGGFDHGVVLLQPFSDGNLVFLLHDRMRGQTLLFEIGRPWDSAVVVYELLHGVPYGTVRPMYEWQVIPEFRQFLNHLGIFPVLGQNCDCP